ncbi:MAG TPA: ATP synthase F0 subunit B [Desulfomonilia bacterium]|nr:ATP synthase F0 subunit B [Desulfomonilia bacterium]
MIEVNFTILIQAINFLLLIFILNKLLYKPILKNLEEREQRIEGQQQQAKKIVEDGQVLMGDYNQKLYNAKIDAMNTKNAARNEASEQANAVIEESRKKAEEIINQMQQQMTSEMAQAKKELEPELSVMAATIAQQILGRKVA